MHVHRMALAILVLGFVHAAAGAQHTLETYVNESMAYTIGVPSGWLVQASPGHDYLNVQPPPGSPEFGLAAIELAIEPSYPGTLEQGIDEVLDGFGSSVPDLQVASRSATSITGVPAAIVDVRGTMQGQPIAHRLVFVLHGQRGYVLILQTLQPQLAIYAPLFDQVLASFTLTDVATPAPGPPYERTTSFAGAFVGDPIILTLESAVPGVHYVGTLQHGEARYPVTAQVTPQGLAGTFESAGHRFDFSATVERDVLTLVTGGTSFVLTRHGAAPGPDPVVTEVPDPCLLLPLMPAGATAGPPPVIELGTRLVYYTAAASIPGERGQLVQDDYGSWIDRETGQRYDERHIPGAGGQGFEVVQVGYLDERLAQLTQRSYLIDGTTGRTMYMREAGVVSHAGCAGDFWIHPEVLAALPDMDQAGTRVLRMPYRLGELVFDAIRIHTTDAAGFTAYVYDLDSGLLLYFGSRTVGPDILTPYPGGESGPGRGSTQLTNGWIRDIQHVDVPWRDAPTPDWIAQVREIEYAGTLTVVVPGSPTFPLPVHQQVQAGHRGRDWLQVRTDSVLYSFEQQPISVEQYVTSHGPASIGGLWIAPQALARLTQGQLIDRCEIVGYTTTVAATSADVVTLSEAGPLHRNDFTYDTRTGLLAAVTRLQQLGDTRHVLELRLVGDPRRPSGQR